MADMGANQPGGLKWPKAEGPLWRKRPWNLPLKPVGPEKRLSRSERARMTLFSSS
jgi:hypothetical protein